jgi:hypothetical protein
MARACSTALPEKLALLSSRMDSHKATSPSGPSTLEASLLLAKPALGVEARAGSEGGSSCDNGKALDVSAGEAVAQPASWARTSSERARLVSIALESYLHALRAANRPSPHRRRVPLLELPLMPVRNEAVMQVHDFRCLLPRARPLKICQAAKSSTLDATRLLCFRRPCISS